MLLSKSNHNSLQTIAGFVCADSSLGGSVVGMCGGPILVSGNLVKMPKPRRNNDPPGREQF